jgi:major type 1 subunit fimbrin (pilin)
MRKKMNLPISKVKLLSSATALLLCSTGAFADPVTVNGGTIQFNGQVVDAACIVSYDTLNQTVHLGQVKLGDMSGGAGKKSTAVPFQIQLDECDPTVQAAATFSFTGTADGSSTDKLLNDATGQAASGIAVQMTNGADNSVVPVDGSSDDASKITLNNGSNIANFNAYMISTSDTPAAGDVHATANFSVYYE